MLYRRFTLHAYVCVCVVSCMPSVTVQCTRTVAWLLSWRNTICSERERNKPTKNINEKKMKNKCKKYWMGYELAIFVFMCHTYMSWNTYICMYTHVCPLCLAINKIMWSWLVDAFIFNAPKESCDTNFLTNVIFVFVAAVVIIIL